MTRSEKSKSKAQKNRELDYSTLSFWRKDTKGWGGLLG